VNFFNRLVFGEGIDKSLVAHFMVRGLCLYAINLFCTGNSFLWRYVLAADDDTAQCKLFALVLSLMWTYTIILHFIFITSVISNIQCRLSD